MKKGVELKNITKLVHSLLEDNRQARNSDSFLYFKVLEYISEQKGYTLSRITVPNFLGNMKEYGFPCFESVRRARQKLQATYPELRACDNVEQFRSENEEAVRDYARGVV